MWRRRKGAGQEQATACIVGPEDFDRGGHRRLWSAILALAEKGEPASSFAVARAAHASSAAEAEENQRLVREAVASCSSSAHVAQTARAVVEASNKRALYYAAESAARASRDGASAADTAARLGVAVERIRSRASATQGGCVLAWSTTAELLAAPQPKARWLIPGILASGLLHVLAALPKSGKSTLIAVLLRALLTGGLVLGRQAQRIRSALVVSEEGLNTLPGMVRAYRLDDLTGLHWLTRESLAPARDFDTILAAIKEKQVEAQPDVIVIDTLARSVQAPSDSEGDNGFWERAMLPLQQLSASGPAVLVLHHTGKADAQGVKRVRGASAIAAAADAVLGLSSRGTFERVLENLGSRGVGWLEDPLIYRRVIAPGMDPGTAAEVRRYELEVAGKIEGGDRGKQDDLAKRVQDELRLDPGISQRALRKAVKVKDEALRACLASGVGTWVRIERGQGRGQPARHYPIESAPEVAPSVSAPPSVGGRVETLLGDTHHGAGSASRASNRLPDAPEAPDVRESGEVGQA